MQPLISIIIPTFDSAGTIKQALTSIVEQTYEHKEVWIIDGKSSDNTIEIVKSYSDRFPFIHYVSEKDNGIYDAMNKGIGLSKGDWLYFLGSDDKFYNNEILSKIFTNSELTDNDVIYGKVNSSRWNGPYGKEFQLQTFYRENICHQAIFLKRRVFSITGNFDTGYRAHADWDHNIKWFSSKRLKKVFISEVIAEYSDGGFSSKGDMVFAFEKELKYWFYFRKQTGFKEKVAWLRLLVQAARLYNLDYLIKKIRRRLPYILVILANDLISQKINLGRHVINSSEYFKPVIALDEIKKIVPKNESVILADQNEWGAVERVCGRNVVPFSQKNGVYWGPPTDNAAAIAEIEQLRAKGYNFIFFASPAYWWLDYYSGMYNYLKSKYKSVLNNERLIGFNLIESIPAGSSFIAKQPEILQALNQ